MILSPTNCTNPAFWGREITFVNGQWVIKKFEMPDEVDFIKTFFPKNAQQAKEYFTYK